MRLEVVDSETHALFRPGLQYFLSDFFAFLSARFSFSDLPTFLFVGFFGDLSAMGCPLNRPGLPDASWWSRRSQL